LHFASYLHSPPTRASTMSDPHPSHQNVGYEGYTMKRVFVSSLS
jgi:hypothetical protein